MRYGRTHAFRRPRSILVERWAGRYQGRSTNVWPVKGRTANGAAKTTKSARRGWRISCDRRQIASERARRLRCRNQYIFFGNICMRRRLRRRDSAAFFLRLRSVVGFS